MSVPVTDRPALPLSGYPALKAAMISNLLVVLVGDKDASPIINAGTLYG